MQLISFLFEKDNFPSWAVIGLYALKGNVPADFIYKLTPGTISTRTDNPVLIHIKTRHEVRKSLGLKNSLSPKTPLRQNELIPMSLVNKILEVWHQKGVYYLEDCYENGSLMSFENLRRKYDFRKAVPGAVAIPSLKPSCLRWDPLLAFRYCMANLAAVRSSYGYGLPQLVFTPLFWPYPVTVQASQPVVCLCRDVKLDQQHLSQVRVTIGLIFIHSGVCFQGFPGQQGD